MLPQKRIEAQDTEDGHGGLRVRVIGGGAASPAAEREVRNLEIGLRIGSGTARKVAREQQQEEEGPIHRLEAEDMMEPVQARDMSEVGPAEPRVSSRASKAKRRSIKHWTVGMGIGSCALAALAVIAQLKARSEQTATVQAAPVEPAAKTEPREEELAYLLGNVENLFPEGLKLLESYAAASSAEEILPLIRDSDRLRDQVAAKWQPWGAKPIFDKRDGVSNLVEHQSTWPSLSLIGKKGNFDPFEVQVVREHGALKIDWEASCGVGDFSIAQLQAGAKAKESLVRAKVGPAKFYTPDYPESAYRSYQLTDLTGYDFVWAFAPLNSPAAEFLSKHLNQDSRILEAGKSATFTLKVTGPRAPGVNMFLINEVLYKGWVAPSTEP